MAATAEAEESDDPYQNTDDDDDDDDDDIDETNNGSRRSSSSCCYCCVSHDQEGDVTVLTSLPPFQYTTFPSPHRTIPPCKKSGGVHSREENQEPATLRGDRPLD